MSAGRDERYRREKTIHDKFWAEGTRRSLSPFYAIASKSRLRFEDLIIKLAKDAHFLELGCGPGGYAHLLATRAVSVTAIDISEKAIELAQEKAAQKNLLNVRYVVMNAEKLLFPDSCFDLVYGVGILHHLDLELCIEEVSRVLKPAGVAVLLRTLGA